MLGALALLTACRTTPLDVVYKVDGAAVADAGAGPADAGAAGNAGSGGAAAGGNAGAGGMAADAGPCSMVGAGRYALRSQANGLCLGQGAPTTVLNTPGFLLNFDTDCRSLERTWQLLPTAVPNVFSLQNLSPPGFVLDVQMAQTRDGTPVITYGVTGNDNQHFEVRARDSFVSELRPQHHPQSCVSALAASAQILTCSPTDANQAWLLQRSDCL